MLNKVLKAPQKQLGIAGVAGAITASIFLAPKQHFLKGPSLIALTVGGFLFARSRWVQSKPNEWMLVINDGKLIKAGIGMKTFIGLTDNVVRFPSKLQRVYFKANNVTKEMQGVEISGVAFWSVYRQQDGPFRCYKYMQGNNANQSVQVMCESILRNLIANCTLDDVLKNRNFLRDEIKSQLKDPFKGWGIWLQTIQITNVMISSTRLFTDMQAEFRQAANLKAEQINLLNNQKISQSKQESDIKLANLIQSVKTRKQQTKNKHMLTRKQMQADFEKSKNDFELKKMQRQKKIQLQKYKNDHEINEQRLTNNQKLEKMRQDFYREHEKKAFEVDKYHDDTTLTKYEIDSIQRTYIGLGSNRISINQYSGGDKDSIAALMPGIGFGMSQIRS